MKKRAGAILGAIALAAVVTVGVVHVVGDSDSSPQQEQSAANTPTAQEQQARMKKAMAELSRKTREYAKNHPPVKP